MKLLRLATLANVSITAGDANTIFGRDSADVCVSSPVVTHFLEMQ